MYTIAISRSQENNYDSMQFCFENPWKLNLIKARNINLNSSKTKYLLKPSQLDYI